MRRTYVGIIQNDLCDIKTLVLAEDAGAAKARVLANFSHSLGRTFREEEVRIVAFGENG
jgi:hypothetical protein